MLGAILACAIAAPIYYYTSRLLEEQAAATRLLEYIQRIRQEVERDRFAFPELVEIGPGCFPMGSDTGDDDERPVHEVCIDRPFYLGRHEVTFRQFDGFAIATGRADALPDDEGWGRGERPAINVSWRDAAGYADWLSDKTGSSCRLPSEAEWEYAARAGSVTGYALPAPAGSDDIGGRDLANCRGCGASADPERTTPVGSYPANAWGLHDMHGNVWEWVADRWHDNYVGAPADGSSPAGSGAESARSLRGGAWYYDSVHARSASRNQSPPNYRYSDVGFRVLCAPAPGSAD